MMESGSFSSLDLDHLASLPVRQAKQSFMSPQTNINVTSATPSKASLNNMPDMSPNYMKSTSCSNARREHLQMSSSKTSSYQRRSSMQDSDFMKLSLSSGHTSVMNTLPTSTSGLKPMGSLPKMPMKKAGRPLKRKNFEVAQSRYSVDGESRFPENVMLHSWGNESEGTSVKVCRCTCCSLNNHQEDNTLLPLAKRFLLARRRFMMTQKTTRLAASSQVRIKPSEQEKKNKNAYQREFNGNPAIDDGSHEAQISVKDGAVAKKENAEPHDLTNSKVSSELAGPVEEQTKAIEEKHGEEWMLDYALMQAIKKLTPAQKKKVGLLVEAFEMVIPLPKHKSCTAHHNHSYRPKIH